MKYTVCVDFDGVLHSADVPFRHPAIIEGEPIPGALEWLERMSQKFDVVVLSTRATDRSGQIAIERWLCARGPFGGIRASGIKVPALIYIDDRAYRFTGQNFPSPEEVHRARPWHKPDGGGVESARGSGEAR